LKRKAKQEVIAKSKEYKRSGKDAGKALKGKEDIKRKEETESVGGGGPGF
jgi:hypothetical protein